MDDSEHVFLPFNSRRLWYLTAVICDDGCSFDLKGKGDGVIAHCDGLSFYRKSLKKVMFQQRDFHRNKCVFVGLFLFS